MINLNSTNYGSLVILYYHYTPSKPNKVLLVRPHINIFFIMIDGDGMSFITFLQSYIGFICSNDDLVICSEVAFHIFIFSGCSSDKILLTRLWYFLLT